MGSGRSGQPDYAGTIIGPRMVPATNERRTTIFNDTELTSGAPPSNRSANDYGKFFPRGMRGILQTVQLYALGNAVGTVTVNISPQPGLGPTYSTTITPPAAWGWVDAAFNVMWNYDSLFVWISACNVAVFWGYDAEPPPDGHLTADSGATWTGPVERPFIRVVMTGETAGDVPISGIVNTIPIPHVSSESTLDDVDVPLDTLTQIGEIIGSGFVDLMLVYIYAAAQSQLTAISIYTDDVLAFSLSPGAMNARGLSDTTPPLYVTQYDESGVCVMLLTKKWEFKRSFRVYAYHVNVNQSVLCYIYPNLIR